MKTETWSRSRPEFEIFGEGLEVKLKLNVRGGGGVISHDVECSSLWLDFFKYSIE